MRHALAAVPLLLPLAAAAGGQPARMRLPAPVLLTHQAAAPAEGSLTAAVSTEPSPALVQAAAPAAPQPATAVAAIPPEPPTLTTEQLIERINQLELEIMKLRMAAGLDSKGKKIALPKNGAYVQADIGFQQREFAGENGITNLMFNPGIEGSLGVGYRYDRNFRFAFEYQGMNNSVSKIRPGIPVPVVDPKAGQVGANGQQFDANGNVKLQSYSLNAYYDLNGFGYQRRFRPYLGAGVGLMTSTIYGLQPSFFPAIGVSRTLDASNTQSTVNVQAGLSYLFNRNTEFYLGGQYTYTSTFLFQNTAFGTLMPNGARNWIIKMGARYAF